VGRSLPLHCDYHSSISFPGGFLRKPTLLGGAYYSARAGAEANPTRSTFLLPFTGIWSLGRHATRSPSSHSWGGCCGPHATWLPKKELLIMDVMAKRSPDQLSVSL